jgi:hypothetical protein
MTPDIIPETSGAPEARAMPKFRGSAIRKTTKPAEKSAFQWESGGKPDGAETVI